VKYLNQFKETVRSGGFVGFVGTCGQEYPEIKGVNKIDSIGKTNNHVGTREKIDIPTGRYLQNLQKGGLPSGESPYTCRQVPTKPTKPSPSRWQRPPELAKWPLALRERWGVHASELEVLGVPFPESERRAFEFVSLQKLAS
jgi:hypothetical protein